MKDAIKYYAAMAKAPAMIGLVGSVVAVALSCALHFPGF